MTTWNEPDIFDVPPALVDAVDGPPLVAQLLVQRGIDDPEAARAFLDPEVYRPTPPTDLPDVDVAVELLLQARGAGTRVCVWGDFDVDGQSATALLVDGLRTLGLDVTYYLPRRDTEGHGVHIDSLRRVIAEDGAGLLLTCDCGVGDHEAVAYARDQGLRVIVTDHHELPETLPTADAIINPHRLSEDRHPLRHLCGVGTAYMLLRALYEAVGHPEVADRWLDFVALGTIADIAVLRAENRYLVQRGLPKLIFHPRAGISALLQTAGAAPSELLDTEIVSFILAPRLNAVGRLDDARTAVELLLTDDVSRAFDLASQLERYNSRRKQLCSQVEAEIEQRLRDRPDLLDAPALVLAGDDWHPGVIGIVASRLVERYGKPTVLLSGAGGEDLHASARSVPGLHLQDAISRHDHLLERGGGHEMAAGFVADPSHLADFRDAFQATVASVLLEDVATETDIAAFVSLADVTPDFVRHIYRLAPFGPGNPEPVLACRGVRLRNVSSLGVSEKHSRLIVEDADGTTRPAVWWRTTPRNVPGGRLDVAFRADLDEFGSWPKARLVIVTTRSTATPDTVREAPQTYEYEPPSLTIEDRRGDDDRRLYLDQLLERQTGTRVQVWAEGPAARGPIQGADRTQLVPAGDLVIWTIPPGPRELRMVLRRVDPMRVHLLTPAPEAISTTEFLQTLAYASKAVLEDSGEVELAVLAARLGHREETVRCGLDFLQSRGAMTYSEEGDRLYLHVGDGQPSGRDGDELLKRLLQETAAYRRYFSRADAEVLLELAG